MHPAEGTYNDPAYGLQDLPCQEDGYHVNTNNNGSLPTTSINHHHHHHHHLYIDDQTNKGEDAHYVQNIFEHWKDYLLQYKLYLHFAIYWHYNLFQRSLGNQPTRRSICFWSSIARLNEAKNCRAGSFGCKTMRHFSHSTGVKWVCFEDFGQVNIFLSLFRAVLNFVLYAWEIHFFYV